MAGLFILLSLVFYLTDYTSPRPYGYLILTLLSFSLALLSKENSIVLSLLILTYHYSFRRKINIGPLLIIVLCSLAYTAVWLQVTEFETQTTVFSLSSTLKYIPVFFVALTNYLKLLILPSDLHFAYELKNFSLLQPKAIMGLIILGALLILLWRYRKNSYISFSLLWFSVALAPVSNIFVRLHFYMAEHFLYLPSIGFFVILARSLLSLMQKKMVFTKMLIIGLIIFYVSITVGQHKYWRDSNMFYTRTLRYEPDNYIVNRAYAYYLSSNGEYEKAKKYLYHSIDIYPGQAKAYLILANIFRLQEDCKNALPLYEKSLQIKP